MEKYILLSDYNQDVLDLEVTALKYFYGGKTVMVKTAEDTIETIKAKGRPEILFVDLEILRKDEGALHAFLEKDKIFFPVIACSDSINAQNLIKDFPLISGVLERPINVDSFTYLVKGLITSKAETPSHVPLDIKTVLDLACNNFDLFLKLSGTNFVKIISKDDVFSYLDAQKLMAKGIKELHILASDTHELLKAWEKSLKFSMVGDDAEPEANVVLAMDAIESIEKISKRLNWNKDIISTVQKTVKAAVTVLSKDAKMGDTIRRRLSNKTSTYTKHVGMMSFINCAFSLQLGWTGESGQLKLVMASLMHDLAVDEKYYEDIKGWNQRAADYKDKDPETIKYRLHPVQGAKIAQAFDLMPPDVDQIILQHHERRDGLGFPRSLSASRIGHLATLFIMVEDFIEFIGDGEHLETSLTDYVMWGQVNYDQGNFKKIFDKLKSHILGTPA